MPIIRSSQTSRDAFVDSCWKLWQEKTLRPNSVSTDKVPTDFRKAIHSIMSDGFDKTDVSNGIIYASYMKPSTDRSADVKRVTRVLSSVDMMNKVYRLSIKLDASDKTLDEHLGHGPFPHPSVEVVDGEANDVFSADPSALDKISELAKVLGTRVDFWPDDDMEYAIELVSGASKKEINWAVNKVRSVTGLTGLVPRDVIRALGPAGFERDAPLGLVEYNELHDVLEIEAYDMDEYTETLEYITEDKAAMDMIRDGIPQEEVAKFHHLAPHGYWKALSEARNNGMSKKQAIDMLEDQFDGFRPSHRSKP